MADSKEPVETLKFHDFTNENSDDFGVVASDQEEEYGAWLHKLYVHTAVT